jgi:hypothetical protein
MFRKQRGGNSTQTAHTSVHISHTPGVPTFCPVNSEFTPALGTEETIEKKSNRRTAEQSEYDPPENFICSISPIPSSQNPNRSVAVEQQPDDRN